MGYDNADIPTDSIYIYNNRITTIGADGAGADCISVMSNKVGNPAEFANLLKSLQKSTAVQVFDPNLKQSLSGGAKQSGGCGSGGGGCCG